MKLFLLILLITLLSIKIIKSEAQNETQESARQEEQKNDKANTTPAPSNNSVTKNTTKASKTKTKDKVKKGSQYSFFQRLKMLPVKFALQVMKTKRRVTDGLSKTIHGDVTGLVDTTGAVLGLVKDSLKNIGGLFFGKR